MEEIKYWGGGEPASVELHHCKKHGLVPNIFMYVTFDGNVIPYPYCAFCWGEKLMEDFPITCNTDKSENHEDKREG